jgi:hypothetical protein
VLTLLKYSRNWGFFFYRERNIDELLKGGYRDIARRLTSGGDYRDKAQKEDTGKIVRIKPIFRQEIVSPVFDLLNGFFPEEDRKILKLIMISGDDSPRALTFLGPGNRLADSFKKLYESDLITGCQKKELESWIVVNFQFRDDHGIKKFKPKYLNNIISTNQIPCKNPILEVMGDRITGKIMIRKKF